MRGNSNRVVFISISAALVALLAVLAALQYRWIGQVSESERERLRAGMQRSVRELESDFNREITKAYLAFQTRDTTENAGLAEDLADRLAEWKQSPQGPMIKDVFLLSRTSPTDAVIERLNPEERRFVRDSSAEAQRLSTRLTAPDESGGTLSFRLGPVDGVTPALVIPAGPRIVIRQDQRHTLEIPGASRTVVVTLNKEYLTDTLLSTLVSAHMESARDYHISVTDTASPPALLYQSDPFDRAVAELDRTADAAGTLLALRIPDIETLLRDGRSDRDTTHGRFEVRILRQDSVAVNPAGAATPPSAAGVFLSSGGSDGAWRLLLHHRVGSLDAAVAQLRARNLAISFTILTVLAAGLGIILINTRRAERLARQQMEFVSTVSHELRTPLAVICSAGENLADGVVESPAHARQYGELLRGEGRRLSEMVEQILDFAGIESGRMPYRLQPIQITEILDRAIDASRFQLQEAAMDVTTNVPDHLPEVQADPAALARAVQNLISNAVKYGKRGRIEIDVRMNPSAGAKDRHEMWISVRDEGIGIPSSELAHIFDPFFRGSQAVDSQIRGSGLGLSLVRQIAEAHRGRVHVTSEPGQGSVFSIALPVDHPGRA